MPIRCRVTFHDPLHCMDRTVTVAEVSALDAARIALKRLLDVGIVIDGFTDTVDVEIINSAHCALPLADVLKPATAIEAA